MPIAGHQRVNACGQQGDGRVVDDPPDRSPPPAALCPEYCSDRAMPGPRRLTRHHPPHGRARLFCREAKAAEVQKLEWFAPHRVRQRSIAKIDTPLTEGAVAVIDQHTDRRIVHLTMITQSGQSRRCTSAPMMFAAK
jgi:hypothetical protein